MSFDGFGFVMGFGWPIMILFWIGLIWLIVWLIQQNNTSKPERDPETQLKFRYVNGEITEKQYEKMKKHLMK